MQLDRYWSQKADLLPQAVHIPCCRSGSRQQTSNHNNFIMIHPPILKRLLIICVCLASLGAAAACNSPDSFYTVIRDATLQAGDPIPAPTDETVLTVMGDIGMSNVDDRIEMDLATLESLQQVEYTVTDPFEQREITYRGVLMTDLFDLWQINPDATTLDVVALNDYQVSVPLQEMYEFPVVFAFMADGEYMEVAYRGPAMLVYPYDDMRFDPSVYNNYWVWQIKSITVQ